MKLLYPAEFQSPAYLAAALAARAALVAAAGAVAADVGAAPAAECVAAVVAEAVSFLSGASLVVDGFERCPGPPTLRWGCSAMGAAKGLVDTPPAVSFQLPEARTSRSFACQRRT